MAGKKIRKIGNIPVEDYYDVRQRRWVWVFPKIDAKMTGQRIVDLETFCGILFPHSLKKQGVAKAIIEAFALKRKPMYLRELQPEVLKHISVSAQTLSDTYKAMVRSGLLEKRYRNDPTYVSRQFGNRLRELAQYWESFMVAKKLINEPRPMREKPLVAAPRTKAAALA